ncbi:ArsC family reductase [Neisseria sicca]|jgi:transcriptional regulator, spx/mgsR family|uniref:ArsC family reductase n=1 Tax=Neisseria sicca TaxID=490 RepID=A0A2I1XDE9_NEISI|nr:ArsC family reductase [Neisseria sicca]OFJ80241.1 arsenate reductase [Neisseria sp. HMSC072F04]PLA40660.1 ArsC family reductase [Neisseria sicca]QTM23838.1 ArsC family reductase [Neisseria sicca]
MIELYGITNCDTVKKARNWLAENNIVYEFSDFKKNAPSEAVIRQWLEQVPLEILLNKRGTTWRKLDDTDRQATENNPDGAIRLMAENPSLIKRPVLRKEGRVYVGFSVENYQKIFSE